MAHEPATLSGEPALSRPSAWRSVSEHLLALLQRLEAGHGAPKDLHAFAAQYAQLAQAYLEAIRASGKTSMRAEAVVKALSLQTGRSSLERFLGRPDATP